MSKIVNKVRWSKDLRESEAVGWMVQRLFAEGRLGWGDRSLKRLNAGLWLRRIYRQCHLDPGSRDQAGFSDPPASAPDPFAARLALFERTAAAMGPEFGVLFQACCLDQETRPSLLCRALDRLADWREL